MQAAESVRAAEQPAGAQISLHASQVEKPHTDLREHNKDSRSNGTSEGASASVDIRGRARVDTHARACHTRLPERQTPLST